MKETCASCRKKLTEKFYEARCKNSQGFETLNFCNPDCHTRFTNDDYSQFIIDYVLGGRALTDEESGEKLVLKKVDLSVVYTLLSNANVPNGIKNAIDQISVGLENWIGTQSDIHRRSILTSLLLGYHFMEHMYEKEKAKTAAKVVGDAIAKASEGSKS